jgi:site-specific DNA-methyltransferase (adenine-specific)
MCGIGSSCIASIETNRNYIGIDVSKEYCKLARERIKLHTSQRKLNI